MRVPGIRGYYQAHSSNYSRGRAGRTIEFFTVHHTAYLTSSLRNLWQTASRNASSTFFAGQGYYEQYLDTDDTPWTNGNMESNRRSITVETRGDWRFGFYDQATLDALTELMYQCLKIYPNLKLTFHTDVTSSATVCPADLKHLGYAQNCWNKAKARISVETKANEPKKPTGLRVDIPDKKVILNKDANLWDMSFTSFKNARAVKALPKGTVIDVAGVYDHELSTVDYYLSSYSWNNGQNYGISQRDADAYVEPKPTPPAPSEPEQPPAPELEEEPDDSDGPGTLPPIPVDPNGEKINEILQIVRWIKNILSNMLKG